MGRGRPSGSPGNRAAAGLSTLAVRFLQEQRMACEVGLYYVLHVAKQRNRNALLRLLPGLGESLPAPGCPGRGGRGALCCHRRRLTSLSSRGGASLV